METDNPEVRRGPGRPPNVKPEQQPAEKFPVVLKRGYFPLDPEHPIDAKTKTKIKVQRGDKVKLPLDEAKDLIRRGIAERADELP